MNWYIIAQKKPISSEALPRTGIAWMDIQGNIYNAGTFNNSHSRWINRYIDFLNDRYNYNLNTSDLMGGDRGNVHRLIDRGWSRIHGGDHFEIRSFSDTETLKRIGYKLSEIYSPSDNPKIIIEGRSERMVAKFYWKDYIESGENFVDFVRKQIQNRW